MFKLQVQEDDKDPQAWHDVKGPDGKLLIFEKEAGARARPKAAAFAGVQIRGRDLSAASDRIGAPASVNITSIDAY
jgi:hypothetical protein